MSAPEATASPDAEEKTGALPPPAPAQAPPDPTRVAVSATHDEVRSALRSLASSLADDIVEPIRDGIEAHRNIMGEIGLDSTPPEEWMERSERLLEYRKVVGATLLEPLHDVFSTRGPSERIRAAIVEALDASLQACRALPEEVSAPWSETALESRPEDGTLRRLAKPLARVVSSARKPGGTRDVPIRTVALRHFDRVLAPAADHATVDAMRRVATWSRRLEDLWMEWGATALPLLVRAERPDTDDEDVSELWNGIREAGEHLQEALEGLADDLVSTLGVEAAEVALGGSQRKLEGDLAVAGSFLYQPTAPAPIASVDARLNRLRRAAPALVKWDEGVAHRMRLGIALLAILAGATAVQRRLVWRVRERCLPDIRKLPEIAGALEALDALPAERPPNVADLEALEERVSRTLAPALEALPSPAEVTAIVSEGSSSAVDALLSMVRQTPSTLALHSEGGKPPSGARPADSRPLAMQELARQSFDAIRIERIRSSTSGLIDAIEQIRADISELPNVFSFAYEEAKREIEEDGGEGDERARELVREAIRSTAESLRSEVTDIETAVTGAQGRLAEEVGAGSLALLDRVAAGSMQARLLAARSRFTALRVWVNEHWGPPVDRAYRAVQSRARVVARLVGRVLRRGSAMVGAAAAEDGGSSRTLRALADPSDLFERLPLVYQRLFSLEPLVEPALLTGRSAELAAATARWSRWRVEEGVPMIVRGRQGSGITSFINALAARIEEDGTTVGRLSLRDRITDEATLAELLTTLLGLEGCATLDELAAAILEADPGVTPAAAVIDNLEHLYLRVPTGTNLVERLLTFLAETEPQIFWIGGITMSAWQLIETAEPTAVSQVDVVELHPLTPQDLREAVIARHRRSGLPVRFEEPVTGRRLLRRRLRRMRDPAAYEELLENDFFDQLQRSSSGHLRLALYQWLRAADFGSGSGVTMGAPPRPDFSLLDSLSLTQNFTLKALLEHRTLTLEEHDAIFRLPHQESYQIFESLGNRHLIEVAPAGERDEQIRSEVADNLRYRICPLVVGAVIGHLRDRNIVH